MKRILNLDIHSHGRLTKSEFLNRVECVKEIRSNKHRQERGVDLYFWSEKSYNLMGYLHRVINKGDFSGLNSHYGQIHIGICVGDSFYYWLKHNNLPLVYRQVICWLSALYFFEPGKQLTMEEQLYPPVFDEIIQLENAFNRKIKKDVNLLSEKEKTKIYHSISSEYCHCRPPFLLQSPFELTYFNECEEYEYNIFEGFSLAFDRHYFTWSDWESVVINQVQDDLIRAESSNYFWSIFLSVYKDESSSRHVFDLDLKKERNGLVYIIKMTSKDYYKIGFTRNDTPENRLSSLQTGNPDKLIIIGCFPCASKNAEDSLHDIFEHKNINGEWFSLCDEDVRNIFDETWRLKKHIF